MMQGPMFKGDQSGFTVTPRIAIRIALLGAVALALFGIVFFRLWYLQVLSGDKYLAEANDNRVREVRLEAPRGDIVDRNGKLLVSNRPSWTIQIEAQRWPAAGKQRRRLYRNLSRLLDKRARSIDRSVRRQFLALPFSNATVDNEVSFREVSTVLEHQEDYPGTTVSRIFERSYPHGALGSHLFGVVREIDEKELKSGKFEGAALGDRVGKDGLEREYDQYLRGRSGSTRVQVDAIGRAKGGLLTTRDPVPGRQLRLTIDRRVQQVGERALELGRGLGGGSAGAFVAMDIQSGEILGLGSNPDFDPAIFTRPVSEAQAKSLFSEGSGAPYANRAISSGYPAGSTYKTITAIAALESGIYTTNTTIIDGGKIKIGDRFFKNAGEVPNGPVSLRRALAVSSDVYFYNFGRLANAKGGDIIQRWSSRYGIGRKTGIDLPGEAEGLVPTPEWENKQPSYRFNGQTIDPLWTVGDMANLSVGQGDLKVTPLQMAVAYAALGNGGNIVKPHLGMRVEDTRGSVEQELEFGPRRPVLGSAANRRAVLEGIRAAASAPGGTSTDVFSDFPIPIAGKTGTAETPKGDQSWYLALGPYPNPRYVVAVTIERGGFGAKAAAPAAKLILARLFNVSLDPKKVEPGSSRTR